MLECEASGVPCPKFLWFKEREPLPNQTSSRYLHISVAITKLKVNVMLFIKLFVYLWFKGHAAIDFFLYRLVIERVSVSDEGNYCCRASNDVNIVFSHWVMVAVHEPTRGMTLICTHTHTHTHSHNCLIPDPPQLREVSRPEILTQPQSEVTTHPGQEVQLVVVAHGQDQLNYQWFCDGIPLPYGTSRELIIRQITADQIGIYTCSITSPSGGSVISHPARVLVSPLPQAAAIPHPIPQPTLIPVPHQPQVQQSYPWPLSAPPPAPTYIGGYENGQYSPNHPPPLTSPDMSGFSEPPFTNPSLPQGAHRNPSPNSPGHDGPMGEGQSVDGVICGNQNNIIY